MQIVENTSQTIVYLPSRWSPSGKAVRLLPGEPGERAEYDFAKFEADKPTTAKHVRQYLSVRDVGAEAPAPVVATTEGEPTRKPARKAAAKKRDDAFAKLSEAEAFELLAQSKADDLGMLEEWAGVEDRETVKKALDQRVTELRA